MCFQGLFLVDFIAVIGLYSQCQKVSFFPNFWRKIPNFKSEKSFLSWQKLVYTVEYSTLHCLIEYIMQWGLYVNTTAKFRFIFDVFYDLTIKLKALKKIPIFLAFSR